MRQGAWVQVEMKETSYALALMKLVKMGQRVHQAFSLLLRLKLFNFPLKVKKGCEAEDGCLTLKLKNYFKHKGAEKQQG